MRDCCAFIFIETYLNIPEATIQLTWLTTIGAVRDASSSGKTSIYINTARCGNTGMISKHCSSPVEFVAVKCRPNYLPRRFSAIVIVVVASAYNPLLTKLIRTWPEGATEAL